MEKQVKIDRITNLPYDVLDTILFRLPLRDAARTSLLSSKWRYKWTGLSQYVLDDKCFRTNLSDPRVRWREIMRILDHVRLNHCGSIEKFKLAAYCCPDYFDLDHWIQFLTEKGIKELILQEFKFVKRFKLPSCLFSCAQLSCLELYGCVLKLPCPFKGLNSLRSLQLSQVSINDCTLETLIFNCPVLERLTLLNIDHLAFLRIQNPTLSYLKVDSQFEDMCLENCPCLASVDICRISLCGRVRAWNLESVEASNLARIFGCLSGIKRLSLSSPFLEFLGSTQLRFGPESDLVFGEMARRSSALAVPWPLLLLLLIGASVAMAERENRSSTAGLFWSTSTEEADLVIGGKTEGDDDSAAAIVNDHDELDGGFPSLDGMLQWAIGHSDPEKLKEKAEDVQRLSPNEIRKRQVEIKELIEKLKMPSDAQLMQIAIDDINNSSLSSEAHYRALEELLILVEPIDNANDLNKLGGLVVVVQKLNHLDPDIRTICAWILGKASQNNPVVQKQILELGALTKLLKMVKSSSSEETTKALYAISGLIRNNLAGQELFYAEAGDLMIQVLSSKSVDIRLQRKAVFLVADLVEQQLETTNKAEQPFFSNPLFLKSVVDLIGSTDLDLQEKALVAIKNLLLLRTTEASTFKDFCGLEAALESTRQQLQKLSSDNSWRDYAADVENLRDEVELIFNRKQGKVPQVPT